MSTPSAHAAMSLFADCLSVWSSGPSSNALPFRWHTWVRWEVSMASSVGGFPLSFVGAVDLAGSWSTDRFVWYNTHRLVGWGTNGVRVRGHGSWPYGQIDSAVWDVTFCIECITAHQGIVECDRWSLQHAFFVLHHGMVLATRTLIQFMRWGSVSITTSYIVSNIVVCRPRLMDTYSE